MNMNQHTIIGNLVRDPETGNTQGGTQYCRFTVAVNRRYKREGGPEADFMRVTVFGGLAESCGRYLKKGKKVAVTGESQASAWNGQDGKARGQIEITAREVEFLSPGEGRQHDAPPEDPPWVADAEASVATAPERTEQVSYTEAQNPEDRPY